MMRQEWKASEGRRKPNRVDLAKWYRLIKDTTQKAWSNPGGPYYLSTGIITAIIIIFALFDISASAGKIHPGITLAGYDIGGLTKKEAIDRVVAQTKKNTSKQISFAYKDKKKTIAPSKVSLSIDYLKSIDDAFKYGRDRNIVFALPTRLFAWLKGADIEPNYKINEDKVEGFIQNIAGSEHRPSRDASIEIKNGRAKLIKQKDGFGIHRKKTEIKIISALLRPQEMILEREKLKSKVTEDEAKSKLVEARIMIGSAAKLRYGSKEWPISKAKIIELFEAKEKDGALEVTLAEEKSVDYIKELTKELTRKAKSAKFQVNGTKVSIINSSDGVKVDTTETYNNLVVAVKRKQKRAEEVLVTKEQPKRTTAKAKKMGIKELTSSFITTYKPGKPRVKNIHLLSQKLDDMLISPGETFSFNARIGQRTAEAGFVAAPQIENNEMVPAIGGGICQVATTFFNTILEGGYPVGARSPHSLFIDHYPHGRDAAVSYPSPDLTFTNDTKSWILIKSGYTSSSISISFYSTDFGRRVTYETQSLGTTPFATKEIKDGKLEEGKKVIEEKGAIGRRFLVIRKVTKDGKVIRETKIKSTFKPQTRVVRVGTKKETEDEKKKKAEEEKKKKEAEEKKKKKSGDR